MDDWKKELLTHKRLIYVSLGFLVLALAFNYLAGNYVDRAGSVRSSDLLLDRIPPIDLSPIFVWGFGLVLIVLLTHPLIFNIKELHVVISQFSLLVLIRSFFITLTHLQAPSDAILMNESALFSIFFFENDLFFSGHTAIPFLGFLLFKKERVRWFFLAATIVMAFTVLAMHVHYSIDVFAALFITYASYRIGLWIFKKIDYGTRQDTA